MVGLRQRRRRLRDLDVSLTARMASLTLEALEAFALEELREDI